MSSFLVTQSITETLRGLAPNETVLIELKKGTNFSKGMRLIGATADRINVKIKQQAMKGVSIDADDNEVVSLIRVTLE